MRSWASTFTAFGFVACGFYSFTQGWEIAGGWLLFVGIVIGLLRAW